MEVPCRGVLEDDALEEHVLTLDEADHDGAEEALVAVPLFLGGGLDDIHVGVLLGVGIALRGYPVVGLGLETAGTGENGLPLGVGDLAALDGTPVLAVAVDDALTGNGDVLALYSRQGRLAAARVEALEGGLDDGIERVVA